MSEKLQNHPGIAAVLSFIFNGLGQLYNGEIKKGLLIMTGTSVSLMVIIIGAIVIFYYFWMKTIALSWLIIGILVFIIGIIAACIIGAYSINDAYQKAAQK